MIYIKGQVCSSCKPKAAYVSCSLKYSALGVGLVVVPMTFRRLEVFVAVVDAGSFVAAANVLGISHPSISNHIRALEDQMRCELFTRRRGTVSTLTEQGRRLYERGQELLRQAELLSEDLSLVRERPKRKPLLISCQRSIASSWLNRPLAQFARDNPDVEFVVEVGRFELAIDDVLANRVDMGFLMSYGPIIDLSSEQIGYESCSFYCASSHVLASKKSVSVKELTSYPFITTKRDSRFGQMVVNMMADAGVSDYHVAHQIQEGTIVQELVMLGLGVFVGIDRIAAAHVHSGALVRVPVDTPQMGMEVHYTFSPVRRQSQVASRFLQFLRYYHNVNRTASSSAD